MTPHREAPGITNIPFLVSSLLGAITSLLGREIYFPPPCRDKGRIPLVNRVSTLCTFVGLARGKLLISAAESE